MVVHFDATTCVAALKTRIRDCLQRDEDCKVLLDGHINFDEPLVFGEEFGGYRSSVSFCGTENCTLTFFDYPELRACADGNVCFASGETAYIEQNERLRLARFPRKGYVRVARADSIDPMRAFRFNDGDIPQNLRGDVRITVWPGGPTGQENWHTMTVGVKEIDYKNRRMVLEKPSFLLEFGAGTRYFLENDPSFICGEGEYCLCGDTTVLRPYATGKLAFCKHKRLISLCGSKQKPIRNFSFENIRIRGAAGEEYVGGEFGQYNGAFYLSETEGFRLRDSEIYNCGGHGISFFGNNKDASVCGCHIHDIGNIGIYVVGYDGNDYVNTGHDFSNNHIHDVGKSVGHGCGIQLVAAGGIRITHNLIYNSPRYAVSLLGRVSGVMKNGELKPNDGACKADSASDITIAYNDVSRCNLDSQDTGVLQAYHAGPNVRIVKNHIHDSNIPFSFGNAIYLDDCCRDFTVAGNLIADMQKDGGGKLSCLVALKGINHTVCRNIFTDNHVDESGGAFNLLHLGNDRTENISVYSNAVLRSADTVYDFTNWVNGRLRFADCNYYVQKEVTVKGGYGRADTESMHTWSEQEEHFDSFSVREDGCTFAKDGGYLFDAYSPAYSLGIEDFDLSAAGLEDYCLQDTDEGQCFFYVNGKNKRWICLEEGETVSMQAIRKTLFGKKHALAASYAVEGDCIENVSDGEFIAAKKGYARIVAVTEDCRRTIEVFVGDAIEKICIFSTDAEVAPNRKFRVYVYGITKHGRRIALPRECVCVSNATLREDAISYELCACKEGNVRIAATAGNVSECKEIVVSEDVLHRAVCAAEKEILAVGESSAICVTGLDAKGNKVALQQVTMTVNGDAIRLSGNKAVAVKEGVAGLEICGARGNAIKKGNLYFTVVGEGENIGVKNVACKGRALRRNGRIALYSNGDNIWYTGDSFTACRCEPGRKVYAVVESLFSVHKDSQAGIVLRSDFEPDSPSVNLRVDATGKIMIATRNMRGGETVCSYQSNGEFPVKLALLREDNAVKAIVNDEEVWDTPDFFAGETVSALALFSAYPEKYAKAVYFETEPKK